MPPSKPETSEPGGGVLGTLSPADFLAGYWQKRPLLIRQALPGFQSPIAPEDLAGLACEPHVESRLVLERGGERPWQLEHGPFAESRFAELPPTHWTLLVQGCDRHEPALAALLERFDFVPTWRVDDVMVSYAAPEGSVGPHVDQYDVFLLQGLGRRRWAISTQPVAPDNCLDETELHIMREFEPEQSWELEPGDMLYLPPGVAHHGVALEPGLTLSIGFRAPSVGDLAADFASQAAAALPAARRYADPDLALPDHPGAISPDALQRVRGLIRQAVQELLADDDALDRWFAAFVTQPEDVPAKAIDPIDIDTLRRRVRAGESLWRSETSRLAYIDHGKVGDESGVCLYVDGEEYPLAAPVARLAPLLCDRRHVNARELAPLLDNEEAATLLVVLCNLGALRFAADE